MEEPPDWALALVQWVFVAITFTSAAGVIAGLIG